MGNFLMQLFIIIFLISVGWMGHWAFTSLDTNGSAVTFEEAQQQFDSVEPDVAAEEIAAEQPTEVPETENEPESNEHQELIDAIKQLSTDRVYMKVGSRGTRVGTVQQFLDLYFDEAVAVDNDYGPGTSSLVRRFQEAEGLSVDGQTGPNTYDAMAAWLEEN